MIELKCLDYFIEADCGDSAKRSMIAWPDVYNRF